MSLAAQEGLCIIFANALTKNFMHTAYINIMTDYKSTTNDYSSYMNAINSSNSLALALEDKDYAKNIKRFHKELYQPMLCSIDSYEQLSEIHRLQKTREWLKKYAIDETEKTITTNQAETH